MISQKILLQNQQLNSLTKTQRQGLEVVAGAALALSATFGPFLLSFTIANNLGFTSVQYPNVTPIAITVALIIVVLSLVLAFDLSKRSALRIAATSTGIFTLLGILTSFTL